MSAKGPAARRHPAKKRTPLRDIPGWPSLHNRSSVRQECTLLAKLRLFFPLLSITFLLACANRASQLPDYGSVPRFEGVDSTGQPFDSKALAGKVWIVDFIYTNCPAECPRMTSQMHHVLRQVQGDDNLELVSISVDPDRDKPAILQAFAQKFGGPAPQWVFLTVSPQLVHELAFNTFHVGDLIGKMEHSTKFILVDKKSKIRGYYSTFEPDGLTNLVKDAEALRKADS